MIRIISDSSTLCSTEQAKNIGFDIAPLSVTINNENFKEYDELTTDMLINKIKKGGIPKSSQPSAGDFLDLYNKYPDDELIVITMASGISGTYNSACVARNLSSRPEKITVVNSRTLCGPQREMVLKAVRLASQGSDKQTILASLNKQISCTYSYLIPRDFDFLKRGGRLSPLVAEIGKLINLTPVLTLSKESKNLISFTKQRSFTKAINKILSYLKCMGVDINYKFYITHADAKKDAYTASSLISEVFPLSDVEILPLSPVFTTQGGPKCIAIQAVLK